MGTDRYSYTKYDALGRITEVGEKVNTVNNPRNSNFLSTSLVNAFLNTGQSAQITRTIYDQALFPYQNPGTARKRVSATTYQDTEGETYPDASYYSYDIMGNVKTLIQRSKMLVAADNSNGEKRIDYQYDLISGKVNKVIYQPGKGDQFIHRYDYDADNRIISVNTSRDGLVWQNDAKYVYHLHGPLARTELGDQKVQGLDYAYTLQGWLKGVNSSSLHDGLFDIGQDGKTGGSLPIVGRDAFGYMLDYYVGDYKPVGQQAFSLNTFTSPSPTPATGFKSLYNGNIGGMVTNIRQLNTPQYTYYHYDQLNRIKRMEALHGQNAAANTWTFGLRFNGYIEAFTYDPNGNIMTLSRNSNVEQIDDLTYNYLAGTNKLTGVTDPIASGLVNYDIDGQAANNYSYDRIGNMTADNAEGITNISWTVYGKIKNITKSTGTIEYRYDASGNRIYKKTFISGATTETYYARDAQGNVMAVYEKQAANPLKWMEQHLYGSSRLGMWNLADVVPGTTIPASGGTVEDGYLYGSKFFELSNHLGNVLVTVSDKKIGIDDGSNGTTDYFQPEVLTAQDYYSFGMAMPGRKYTKPNSGYRYGFNGKENDNDIKGEGNQQDYGMRIYDVRLGRFLSMDPISRQYPELTPFQFASNTPIWALDLDGLEMGTYGEAQAFGDAFVRKNLKEKGYSDAEIEENSRATRNAIVVGNFVGTFWAADLMTGAHVTRTGASLFSVWQASQLYEYTNRNSHQKIPSKRAENSQQAIKASVDLAVGFGLGKTIDVLAKVTMNTGKIVYKVIHSSSIRFSQSSVKGSAYNQVKALMQEGKDLGAIDIVRMKDGIFTSLDNKRLMAAQELDRDISAIAHEYDDVLDAVTQQRIFDAHGVKAKTWGEAVEARTSKQAKYISRDSPNGSFIIPKKSDK